MDNVPDLHGEEGAEGVHGRVGDVDLVRKP